MGGMKIDLNALANMVADKAKVKPSNGPRYGSKPAAPWRSEVEVAELREKKLCLRCKKPGHQARFCRTYGPPRPAQMNNSESLIHFVDDETVSGSGKD